MGVASTLFVKSNAMIAGVLPRSGTSRTDSPCSRTRHGSGRSSSLRHSHFLYGLSLLLTKALAGVAPLRSLVGLEAAKIPRSRKSVLVGELRRETLQGVPGNA